MGMTRQPWRQTMMKPQSSAASACAWVCPQLCGHARLEGGPHALTTRFDGLALLRREHSLGSTVVHETWGGRGRLLVSLLCRNHGHVQIASVWPDS